MKKTFTFLLLVVANLLLANNHTQFYIECPADVTVSCDDELWDLSIYGTAYVHGYGNPTPLDSPEIDYYLNDCNVGSIERTWTASDYSGNVYSCTQVIKVKSNTNNQDLDIQWPSDYVVNACSADLHPDNLPDLYDYPSWNDQTCAMIMQNYTDAVFSVDNGCKKILRKWKLIDWCTYDPNSPASGGKWEHTQILKVMSTEKPNIVCISDITVSAGSDCYYTYVDLDNVTASNSCNSNISITNNSPFADNEAGDASGLYPLGTTVVKYTARDGCENVSECKVKVTVVDKKLPVPICLHGLSATLAVHHDGYYVRIYPELFDKGSYDNCTEQNDLQLRVEPEILECSDLDTARVKLIVTDEEGNSNYCETYVYLTDNQGKCPPTNTVTNQVKIVNFNGVGADKFDPDDSYPTGFHRSAGSTGNRLFEEDFDIGIESFDYDFEVYPNPLNTNTSFKFYLPRSFDVGDVQIRLLGIDGKIYHQWANDWSYGYNRVTMGSNILNILPKGVFILQLVTNHSTITKRIINP